MNRNSGAPRFFLGAALLEPGRGGIARVARMTARALHRAGEQLDVLSYLDRQPVDLDGKPSAVANGRKLLFAARCSLAAVGHTHFIYDSGGIARAHPRLPGLRRPYAVWMHGIEAWETMPATSAGIFAGAKLVLVNSEFTLGRFKALHGPLDHARVCWLATEDDEPPAQRAGFTGPPRVLALGRIDASEGYKGHDQLVACWPRVSAAVPGARLVIAGDGPALPALRDAVHASPASASIDVLGFVPERDMPALWQQTHALALPSRKEGFGLVYVEAMRHGVPVIASTHDAGQEVNLDGVTGYNVNLERRDELGDRIIALLSDDRRARMGEAGFRRWQDHFRFSAFERRLLPLVTEFVRESQSTPPGASRT